MVLVLGSKYGVKILTSPLEFTPHNPEGICAGPRPRLAERNFLQRRGEILCHHWHKISIERKRLLNGKQYFNILENVEILLLWFSFYNLKVFHRLNSAMRI